MKFTGYANSREAFAKYLVICGDEWKKVQLP
jgi:hypothetical protein